MSANELMDKLVYLGERLSEETSNCNLIAVRLIEIEIDQTQEQLRNQSSYMDSLNKVIDLREGQESKIELMQKTIDRQNGNS